MTEYPNRARETLVLDALKPKKNYVVLTLHANGKVTKIVQAKDPSLEQLQAGVGGPIERIPHFTQLTCKSDKKVFGYNRGTCWANEEGKIRQMPLNIHATEIWKDQYAYVNQWLVGDLVFVARTTESCNRDSE